MHELDLEKVPTPAYVIDRGALGRNLDILGSVQERTGCKILLALKGFAAFSVFPQLSRVLRGACASSVDEARLAYEEFGGEVHVFAPAYSRADMERIAGYADHIVFNSFAQREAHRELLARINRPLSIGLRINPEYSEVATALYNPCGRFSRLGITAAEFQGNRLDGIDGLHFHALCGQNAGPLARTVEKVEERFGRYLEGMKWVNFGGGHHITRDDYDLDLLCETIINFRKKYGVEVYLEPGEAVGLNAGVLVTSVMDIVRNEIDIAILDTSVTCHMPDVLEMPYRPVLVGAGINGQQAHTYRLGGLSCLAGDVVGDYSFAEPLQIGQKLVFTDMAHYTMVKTTTFNGVRLPSICLFDPATGELETVRTFGYEDYKSRLS